MFRTSDAATESVMQNDGTPTISQILSLKDCAIGLRILTGLTSFIIWTASVTLAYKYQLVASNME